MNVAEKIATIEKDRLALGVSVSQLCRNADLNEATYHRLGRRTRVHQSTIRKLESALFDLVAERAVDELACAVEWVVVE